MCLAAVHLKCLCFNEGVTFSWAANDRYADIEGLDEYQLSTEVSLTSANEYHKEKQSNQNHF